MHRSFPSSSNRWRPLNSLIMTTSAGNAKAHKLTRMYGKRHAQERINFETHVPVAPIASRGSISRGNFPLQVTWRNTAAPFLRLSRTVIAQNSVHFKAIALTVSLPQPPLGTLKRVDESLHLIGARNGLTWCAHGSLNTAVQSCLCNLLIHDGIPLLLR